MQFVDFFQFFLELSNCRIWILAIWRKKVSETGNLAKKVSDTGNLANFLESHQPLAIYRIQPLSMCLLFLYFFCPDYLKQYGGGVGSGGGGLPFLILRRHPISSTTPPPPSTPAAPWSCRLPTKLFQHVLLSSTFNK